MTNESNGVSLVIVPNEPTPPPPKKYVLTLDERHAEFLFSLLCRIQVSNEAGNLSYDIFLALRGNVPRTKTLKLKYIARLGTIEVDYSNDD